ncbi:putative prolin-rich extensin-like receptor protein kinase family protein [Iris pallida]|uniref:Prolin-rich extensin-like receptor protein kinase family protein n=1 Tax=Iris pallida TaxID=29817 RepID=A0AAX6H8N1_IRIPA|nr:putative prolin-rich extensin-like receptor protein kinase family protein [Iris pallida]
MTARPESEATLRTPSSSLSVNFLLIRVVRPYRVESMMRIGPRFPFGKSG